MSSNEDEDEDRGRRERDRERGEERGTGEGRPNRERRPDEPNRQPTDENENENENEEPGPSGGGSAEENGYELLVPLDAEKLEQLREEKPQDLQVVGRLPDGTTQASTVELEEGTGVARLTFDQQPEGVGVWIGSDRATTEELLKSQTIRLNVRGDRWIETPEVELDPVEIPAYYWDWWYRWCREFTIRGRLVCPDGNPVPGAGVCVQEVDSWFIWSSTQEVGCATTDQHGTFEITFRWCCGFWPWWWWELRTWRPDPFLVEKVSDVIRREPDLSLGRTEIQPNLDIFEGVVEDEPIVVDQSLIELEPDQIDRVRDQLLDRLPAVPELERLNVWPWVPWRPWWDCTPDVKFEATQDGDVILEEDITDTRWNIDQEENVEVNYPTLLAHG